MDDTKTDVAVAAGVIDVTDEEFAETLNNFRLLPDNAVPIAPSVGTVFMSRFDDGLRALKDRHKEWETNIDAYNMECAADLRYAHENMVRITVDTLLDYTYMRNPTVELSSERGADDDFVSALQSIVKAIINRKSLPGINLRPKAQRQIVVSHLTNFGILELTHQGPKGSVEQVLSVLDQTREKIKKEEDADELGKLFSLLDILNRELTNRRHEGIGVEFCSPFSFIVDPDCQEPDFSDARWLMKRTVMDEDHIKAEYMVYNPEMEAYYHRYDPSQPYEGRSRSVTDSREATETEIINNIMPDVPDEIARVRAKGKVAVVWVYDKSTRLKYLYLEGKWDTPLWVYEDEMGLSRFYPFFLLTFSNSVGSIVQPGEVAHYRTHEEQINEINKMSAQVRRRVFTKYVYNASAIDPEEARKLFNHINNDDTEVKGMGIKMRDNDRPIGEVWSPMLMPAVQLEQVFDKRDLVNGIDRATRINDAMRGVQFRTNTNTAAVDTYNEFANSRTDGLTDRIEGCMEDLLWAMCELIVTKVSPEQVQAILPAEKVKGFRQMTVEEFNLKYNVTVAAGSTEKPTSQMKKREAREIIQMLGQFGTAAPMTVLNIVGRLLQSAFSKFLFREEDAQRLAQEGQANLQKGISSTPQNQGTRP